MPKSLRPDDRRVCYRCAYDIERESLLTADRAFCYLHADERTGTTRDATLTTWLGDVLMRVTSIHTARVGFPDCTGRRPVRYFLQAIDVHGARWIGTSPGPGMYARMRRAK